MARASGDDEALLRERLRALLAADAERLRLLSLVAELGLRDGWIAAGFVRNLVWDHVHGFPTSALNDVDVVFHDPDDDDGRSEEPAARWLNKRAPEVHWEVRNQARMHRRNGDPPYGSVADAMTWWPERETAVAARLDAAGAIELSAPFGLASLFAGVLTPGPKRRRAEFERRVAAKGWLTRWPRLRVVAPGQS